MSDGRRLRILANVLTLARYAVAGAIVAAGLTRTDSSPYQRLCLIVGLNIVGWTTDMVDGWAARKSGLPSSVWGGVDLVADLLLQWSTAYALGVARFVPFYWINLYLLLVVLALAVKPSKNMSQITSLPLVLLPAGVCLRYYPELLLFYLGWAVCASVLFWTRLCTQAADFIDRMPAAPRKWFGGLRDWVAKQR